VIGLFVGIDMVLNGWSLVMEVSKAVNRITGKMASHQFSEDELWAILSECICDALGVKPDEVTPDSRTIEDLGMN
jgi:hypothetical protein